MATRTQTPAKAIQLVSREPRIVFNDQVMQRLIASSCDAPKDQYPVVSIIGQQSGGKSTLLNTIFNTDFGVMNHSITRGRTTEGIWAAICNSPRAVVLDIEGTDSLELLQKELGFENRSALFALVISDVLFINVWLHNIGVVNGIPLLTNIFQERAKKAGPHSLPEQHKTTIIFAVRDYDGQTPKKVLKEKLISMVSEIWKSIPQVQDSKLDNYFELRIEFFPHLIHQKQEFYDKCAQMRTYFDHAELVHRRQFHLPVSEFPSDAKELWEKIMKNKTLDLPSQRETRARRSCKLIMSEKFQHFQLVNKKYLDTILPGKKNPREFDGELKQIIDNIVSEYNSDAQVYGTQIADEIKDQMLTKILHLAKPAFKTVMNNFKAEIIEKITNQIKLECVKDDDGIEEKANAVVSGYSKEFLSKTNDLKFYSDLTDQSNILKSFYKLGRDLSGDIKGINRHQNGLAIATGVLATAAVATGGIGVAAAAAGYLVATATAGAVAAFVTATGGAAIGTGAALGVSKNDVDRAATKRVLEISEELSDAKENTGAPSSSSSSK